MRIHDTFGVVLAALLFTSVAAQKRILVDCMYTSISPCPDLTNADQSAVITWNVTQTSTPSQETGATNGINDAFFVFMETSNRNQGDYANLMTGALGVTGDVCVEFSYHMYGEEMGTLNLVARTRNGDNVAWTKSGNQLDTWYHETQTVSLTSSSDQIIFNGVRGNGYRGDISLDEIKITSLSCDDNSQIVTTPPTSPPVSEGNLPMTCEFDSTSDTCSITQDDPDQYSWAISLSGTPSLDTGPTLGYDDSKGFIYAEATDQDASDIARFSLPQLSTGNLDCAQVEFYYHLYGAHMGGLNVYVGSSKLFEITGDQGNQWFKASFQALVASDQRVTFEAVRGTEYASDIAVDHIKVTNCGSSGGGGDDSTTVTAPTAATAASTTSGGGGATGSIPYFCPFDNDGTNCSLSQDNGGDSWVVSDSGTPSSQTGPENGQGGSGGFIFYEATGGNLGDRARFTLPALLTSGSLSCARVKFYYYMYGTNMGTLNVYTRSGSNQNNAQLQFTASGDKGTTWLETSFDTAMDPNTIIVFEMIRGDGFASDGGVDSVTVTDCSGGGGGGPSTQKPPTNVPYKVRLQPQAVWVTRKYPAKLTCGVDDPEYISPFNLSIAWYFPNGSSIAGDSSTPGFIWNYVYSANTSTTSLGWWKTTLFVDNSLDFTMSGDYTCKVRYAAYPVTVSTSSLFFQGCPRGYYTCPRSDGCVPCSALCDGLNDCGDFSDEFKCGGPASPQCNNKYS